MPRAGASAARDSATGRNIPGPRGFGLDQRRCAALANKEMPMFRNLLASACLAAALAAIPAAADARIVKNPPRYGVQDLEANAPSRLNHFGPGSHRRIHRMHHRRHR